MSKDRSERMAKDMSERYVRRNVIRKSVKRFVRKNGKRYVRKMSERMSEDMSERMSEDMSGRTSENMSQVYVHTQIWITRIHVCTNGILWNVLRRSSLGLPIRLPKELSMCGATSWLLLVLSACTCAWSRLALHMLGIWCLSWKKSWRETSGMWHMKGGLFQMRRASKSWRSALQSFVLRPRFGRMECMNGRQTTCGAGPPMQNRRKHRSGEHLTSWFAHAMRCSCGTSNSFAFLDSTAFWRGGLMHVVCVCVCVWNYGRFASLDLTAFWRGGPMHWGRWHLQAQSCHGYYFCCVVRGKYRVCRAAFLWSCGC